MTVSRSQLVNTLIVVLGVLYLLDPLSVPGRALRSAASDIRSRWVIHLSMTDLRMSNVTLGPTTDSPVIVEFIDYECPFCIENHRRLRPLIDDGKLSVVVKHFPITSMHSRADVAARIAFCAGEQGQGSGMHNALMEVQDWEQINWQVVAVQAGVVNLQLLSDCMASSKAHRAVLADVALGRRIGVTGTPAFVVNGKLHRGILEAPEIEHIVLRDEK